MIRKIEEKEIMTTREARERYENHHIGFVTTEQRLSDPDNEKGYVVYLADDYSEAVRMPKETEDGTPIWTMRGYAVYDSVEIGGIYFGGAYHD